MTWIIEFVLRTSMGVLGGTMFAVIAGLIMETLPRLDSWENVIAGLNKEEQWWIDLFSSDGGQKIILVFIVLAMINAFLDMNNLKEPYVDNEYDSVDGAQDWYMDTQIHEHYGYKM